MDTLNLADEYERLCETPSDIYLHLPRFVAMVEALDAQHVIELGTRTGVSTLAWLHALQRTGGRLTSVDIDARPPIGEHAHWTFIQGDDMDPAISGSLDVADIVFIDTSHHYTHTLRELHTYRWLVKPGGLIVCHDTELPRPEGMPPSDPVFPVKKAIERFVAEAGLVWSNVSECWGLGIIEVV
jgi:cephalosporin hydroxylase